MRLPSLGPEFTRVTVQLFMAGDALGTQQRDTPLILVELRRWLGDFAPRARLFCRHHRWARHDTNPPILLDCARVQPVRPRCNPCRTVALFDLHFGHDLGHDLLANAAAAGAHLFWVLCSLVVSVDAMRASARANSLRRCRRSAAARLMWSRCSARYSARHARHWRLRPSRSDASRPNACHG